MDARRPSINPIGNPTGVALRASAVASWLCVAGFRRVCGLSRTSEGLAAVVSQPFNRETNFGIGESRCGVEISENVHPWCAHCHECYQRSIGLPGTLDIVECPPSAAG
jgi:hypothetical protein